MLILCLEINIYKLNLSILYVAISQDYSPSFKILGVVYRAISSWKCCILCDHPFRTWDISSHHDFHSFTINFFCNLPVHYRVSTWCAYRSFQKKIHSMEQFVVYTLLWEKCCFFQFSKFDCNPDLLIVIQYYGPRKDYLSKWLKMKWEGQKEELLQNTDQLRYLCTKEKTTRW